MKLKFTYLFEYSDHDGYCSGDECEYFNEDKTCEVDVPFGWEHTEYHDEDDDALVNGKCMINLSSEELTLVFKDEIPSSRLVKKILQHFHYYAIKENISKIDDLNHGSGFCGRSLKVKESKLTRHDYNITIKKVESFCTWEF